MVIGCVCMGMGQGLLPSSGTGSAPEPSAQPGSREEGLWWGQEACQHHQAQGPPREVWSWREKGSVLWILHPETRGAHFPFAPPFIALPALPQGGNELREPTD